MFMQYLQGSNVFRDETDGEADGGGGDRGDDYKGTIEDELEVESSEVVEEDDKEEDKEDKSSEDVEDKEEKKEEKKPAMVPQKRMKEAVDKERKAREATEAKLKEATEKLEEGNRGVDLKKLSADIEELDELLDKAIADGNVADKKRIRGEIREKQMTLARAEAAALSAQATAIAVERVRYDALVERLEKEHPEMNPEADEYSEEIIAEIVDLKSAYEAKGESSSDALKKATKYVFKALAPKKEEAKEEEEEDPVAKAEAEAERRAAAIKKAQAAKGKQPAMADKGGKASDKGGGGMAKNMGKITDAEFDKLDEKELARLRGDSV